uniref:Uncharacterized protein n=1 Tax=Anguilla anguilla TaxID=7936 RepID=A0A0E9SNG4_ANGAN
MFILFNLSAWRKFYLMLQTWVSLWSFLLMYYFVNCILLCNSTGLLLSVCFTF